MRWVNASPHTRVRLPGAESEEPTRRSALPPEETTRRRPPRRGPGPPHGISPAVNPTQPSPPKGASRGRIAECGGTAKPVLRALCVAFLSGSGQGKVEPLFRLLEGLLMPITFEVLADLNLIVLRAADPMDDADLRKTVVSLSEPTAALAGFDEIVDCRGVEDVTTLSARGVLSAGQTDRVLRARGIRRLVVIVRSTAAFGLSRMYLTAADADPQGVFVTYALDDAMAHLGYDETRKAALRGYLGE